MVDTSSYSIQALSNKEDPLCYSAKDGKQSVGEHLTIEQYIQQDKPALARLLQLGMADMLAQGQAIDLDTNEELPRLIPVLCAYFSRDELTQLLDKKMAALLFDMHRTEVLQNLFLELEFQKVLHAFNEAQIQLMLFKGPALAYMVYPQAHLRTYHDIDALIRPADLERARDLLSQMGYTFYEEFRANVINSKRTGYNFMLKRPDSWLEVLIELHTAPHESEIGTDFDIESLWAKAQSATVLGEPALTMDPVDHLLYLCWHYRFHGFSRLLWLYDLVVIVRALGQDLDWQSLVQRARRQRLATTLYYCLSWCGDLFAVDVPEHVYAQLVPPLACRIIVERIVMPDVARTLASAQCQSRRILARRAMVDTTFSLLGAGVRTLFPTSAAMGQRYMEHSRLPLRFFFLYYLIHPWITLAKGVRYLLPSHRGLGRGKHTA